MATNVMIVVQEPGPDPTAVGAPDGPSGVSSPPLLAYLETIDGDVDSIVKAWAAENFISGTAVSSILGAESVTVHHVTATAT